MMTKRSDARRYITHWRIDLNPGSGGGTWGYFSDLNELLDYTETAKTPVIKVYQTEDGGSSYRYFGHCTGGPRYGSRKPSPAPQRATQPAEYCPTCGRSLPFSTSSGDDNQYGEATTNS